MNKIIFQVGLLIFFVCIVLFTNQSVSLLDAVARAFLVFIGVVFVATLALGASLLFSRERPLGASPEKQLKVNEQGHTVEV